MKTEEKIKLSPKQREVIMKMREGYFLSLVLPIAGPKPYFILFNDQERVRLSHSSVPAAIGNGDEDLFKVIPGTLAFELTELGKSIEI